MTSPGKPLSLPDPVARPAGKTKDEDAFRINKAHREVMLITRRTIEKALLVGKLLYDKKISLGHGNFDRWRAENLEFSDRTARRYAELHRNRATIEAALKTASVTDLADAYNLLHGSSKRADKGSRDVVSPDYEPHAARPSNSKIEGAVILREESKSTPSPALRLRDACDIEDAKIVLEKKEVREPEPLATESKTSAPQSAWELWEAAKTILEQIIEMPKSTSRNSVIRRAPDYFHTFQSRLRKTSTK